MKKRTHFKKKFSIAKIFYSHPWNLEFEYFSMSSALIWHGSILVITISGDDGPTEVYCTTTTSSSSHSEWANRHRTQNSVCQVSVSRFFLTPSQRFSFNLWPWLLCLWLLFYSIFFIIIISLPAYLSNHNPFSREHIFESFNKFPFLVCYCIFGQTVRAFLSVDRAIKS